jgi:hypothetical protein
MGEDKNKDDEQEVPVLDARGEWFEEKVTTALRLKSDKWKRLAQTPDCV